MRVMLLSRLLVNKMCKQTLLNKVNHFRRYSLFSQFNTVKLKGICPYKKQFLHDDTEIVDSDTEELDPKEANLYEDQPVFTRNLLYPNSNDKIIKATNKSNSVQDVFDVLKENEEILNYKHITQAVVVIWDLLKIFYHVNGLSDSRYNVTTNNFTKQLNNSEEFAKILKFVKNHVDDFDTNSQSYVLLYLNKLGLNVMDDLFQLLVYKINKKLMEEFSIEAASRFTVAVFTEMSLRPYFVIQDVVPKVFDLIDSSDTADEIKFLTICLSNLRDFVTEETLAKYKRKIYSLLDENVLTYEHYKTIIKILMFLNFPNWRVANVHLIRQCTLLLQNKLNLLSANEILNLFDVFSKNQEPGEILNELNRCCSKHLLQMEEELNPNIHTRLKLLFSVIFFMPAMQKASYKSLVKKYMEENLIPDSLFTLSKLLVQVKTSDVELCEKLWDNMSKLMKIPDSNLLRLCTEYTRFNVDINNYRHKQFEKRLLHLIHEELMYGCSLLIPSSLAHFSTCILPYCNEEKMMDILCMKLYENWEQLSPIDCLKISKGLQIAREVTENKTLRDTDIKKLNYILNKSIKRRIGSLDLKSASVLTRSFLLRDNPENYIIKYLFFTYEFDKRLCSMVVKSMVHCLRATNSYIPEAMRNMTSYISENKNHVMAFTVEKVLHLCYFLNHQPENPEVFFNTTVDIIIRDKERLNALSFIQVALALCYFNKLPISLIKQIFNVTFLEKLDYELATCYSKETYPDRVRNEMMQLNRAVCLDYPEANIPWFHQKYVEQLKNKDKEADSIYHSSVEETLRNVIVGPESLHKDVYSPYGYKIDFLIQDNSETTKKLAIVLLKPKAFTNVAKQLKGKYQLERRHLEILGYKVIFVRPYEWRLATDSRTKEDYFKKLIYKDVNTEKYTFVDR